MRVPWVSPKQNCASVSHLTFCKTLIYGDKLNHAFPPEGANRSAINLPVCIVTFINEFDPWQVMTVKKIVKMLQQKSLVLGHQVEDSKTPLIFRFANLVPSYKSSSFIFHSIFPPKAVLQKFINLIKHVNGSSRVHMKKIGRLEKTNLIRTSFSP